jgi:ABC-2 type transport system permease protein
MFAALSAKARVYGQIFALGLQNALTFRGAYWIYSVASLAPLLSAVFLWSAVFKNKETVAGYHYDLMITYFAGAVIMNLLTSTAGIANQTQTDIKDGLVNQVLIKPLHYFCYRLFLFTANRLAIFAMAIVPIVLFFAYWRSQFPGAPIEGNVPVALAAMVGAYLLEFCFYYCLSLLAFWMLEITSLVVLTFSVEYLVGGMAFPLDALPHQLYVGAMLLPCAYVHYFPIATLLGRLQGPELMAGFAVQWLWILVLYLVADVIWKMGMKKYTAVGG